MLRAAMYCRVSTDEQGENTSLASQEIACSQYAAGRNYTVASVYRDVHSGYELWERPAMRQLLDAIRRRAFDVVICHALDRLSRRQTHTAILVDECERAGIALLFVTEEFEKSAVGDFIRSARAFNAEFEREKIRERMQRGLRSRIESGKPLPGSRPLFGYRWRDEAKSGLEIAPEAAAIVRRIFEQAAGGTPLRRIADQLTADDIPTPTGKRGWKQSTIHAIVVHQGYAGEAEALRYATEKVPGGGRHVSQRDRGQRVSLPVGTIPPLVDAETFAEVGRRLARNRAESAGRPRDPEAFLLRGGYVRCGYCGKAVSAKWSDQRLAGGERGKVAIYALGPGSDSHRGCQSISIRAATLDAAAWSRVEAILTRPEILVKEVARLRERDTSGADLAAIDRQITEVERRRGNLGKRLALFEDDADAAPLVAEIKSQSRRLADLYGERALVLQRHAGWQVAEDRLAELERWCEGVTIKLGALDYEQRRLALEALGIRVTLYRREHTPRYEITAAIAIPAVEHKDAPPTALGRSVNGTLPGHRRRNSA